jgi:hypothetical protein
MLTVVLTVFLAAGIVVSIINVATILSGNGWRRPRWMRSEPAAATLTRTPEAVVAVARARASAAATAQRVPFTSREPIALPAGPARASVAAPKALTSSVTLDQVRYLVDDLVANNPDQLAQIITDWINEVPDTGSFGDRPRPTGGR